MHLDEEQVERIRHGELEPAAEDVVRLHLTQCTDCRDRVDAAKDDERAVLDLLCTLDHAPPRVDAVGIMHAARRRGAFSSAARRAAGVVLALGLAGAAAWALPGSPLRSWLRAAAAWLPDGAPTRSASVSPGAPVAAPPERSATAGIAIDPGQSLVIEFLGTGDMATATVTLHDGAEVRVRAPSGAAAFTSNIGHLVVERVRPAAGFEIEIPRSAPHVRILVDARVVFTKRGNRVVVDGADDTPGRWLIALATTGR